MKIRRNVTILVLIAVVTIVFSGCDLLFDLLGSDDESQVLVLDLDDSFFSNLNTDSLSVKINGEVVKTITESDITDDPTSFNLTYSGDIFSITLATGGYSELYNEIDDFIANDDAAVASMADIKKIDVYAFWNFWSEAYTGIGAKIRPLD